MVADTTVILVLLSKIPIYLYVIYRAYKLRRSLILISTTWLGLLAALGAIAAIFVATQSRFIAGLIAYGVVFALFMLAYTAKELKGKEK